MKKRTEELQENFNKALPNLVLLDRSLDKLHRIYRKFSDKKITQKVVNRGDLGLIALHMQPELNTEPLAGTLANPITWIETVKENFLIFIG